MDYDFHNEVRISVGNILLSGELIIPVNSHGVIVFAHGSGSSRFSVRNQSVAAFLRNKHFGTLLFDLLTPVEDRRYLNRFDIELLTKRLIGATEWLEHFPQVGDRTIGYFGASTGAAAALKAAAYLPQVGAVVSRGGRPDLAMNSLPKVDAPTLLIVGSLDYDVLEMNRAAFKALRCEKKLAVIEGATHLFEESGTLEQVAEQASNWFEKYLLKVKV
ncbi:MAG: dienelactone hydrolase family protein [Bacteroidota bacterium]|nr:dienelactone hydrolase family protein [Bacteroidota bacterium]